VDRDNKLGKPSGAAPAQDSYQAASAGGPKNTGTEDSHRNLFPEMRRPKPNQEAIAAALQAMQRLTMKMDSETAVEGTAPHALSSASSSNPCPSCGHHNREGNKFCGMCGLPIEASPEPSHAGDPSNPELSDLGSSDPEIANLVKELTQARPAPEGAQEVHPPEGGSTGAHHYHHHYHHHYFQGGVEEAVGAPRGNASESVRETDRLRIAAAAKGEPMSRSEAAVRRLTQEWVLACNTRQLDELLDLYAPDALVLRSNLPLLRGAAAVREFFFSALESGLGEVSVEPVRVEVIGDVAHEVGRYSALVPGTEGKRREERGKYLWVFAKQSSGDWKLISECWSSDLTLTNAESDIPKTGVPSALKPRKP
jgi:uncharacterized protein (TIGR02246 family)